MLQHMVLVQNYVLELAPDGRVAWQVVLREWQREREHVLKSERLLLFLLQVRFDSFENLAFELLVGLICGRFVRIYIYLVNA